MQYCLALNRFKDILWVDFIYFKISYFNPIDRQQLGPRLLIKFLQDAAGKGELDPWDIDVISVIDSFLEQYTHTFNKSLNGRSSYHKDLAETSEAFFAASVLVNLKNYIVGAFRMSLFLVPENIFTFTALLTAVKSLSTKLLIEAR